MISCSNLRVGGRLEMGRPCTSVMLLLLDGWLLLLDGWHMVSGGSPCAWLLDFWLVGLLRWGCGGAVVPLAEEAIQHFRLPDRRPFWITESGCGCSWGHAWVRADRERLTMHNLFGSGSWDDGADDHDLCLNSIDQAWGLHCPLLPVQAAAPQPLPTAERGLPGSACTGLRLSLEWS